MSRPLDWIRNHQKDLPIVLFLVAGLVGVFSQQLLPARHGGERWNLAWSLADHGSFANPLSTIPTGPTAGDPPLASVITAGLIRLFRAPFHIYLSSALLSILGNAISASLLPRLSVAFFGDVIPGIIAAFLWLFTMQIVPGWDTNYIAAALIAFACLTASIFEAQSKPGTLRSIGLGVFAGAMCLLNASSLLIWLPWIVLTCWKSSPRNRNALATLATICGVAALIVLSWCARNQRAVGSFAVRTGFGLEFYVSNNDCAAPTIMEEQLNGCFHKLHPNSNIEAAREFQRLGEVQYDKAKGAIARDWITSHPARFIQLTAARMRDFWFPDPVTIPDGYSFPENFGVQDYVRKFNFREHRIAYCIWLVTFLSIPGFVIMIRERNPVAWFVVAAMAIYPLMYYITITEIRYRDPALWISLLPAGYFLTWFIERRTPQKAKTAQP